MSYILYKSYLISYIRLTLCLYSYIAIWLYRFLKAFFSRGEGEQKAIGSDFFLSIYTADIIPNVFDT